METINRLKSNLKNERVYGLTVFSVGQLGTDLLAQLNFNLTL
jgi:hypothetical protein